MRQDVDGPIEVDEGVERVPGGVLRQVLAPNSCRDVGQRSDLALERQEPVEQRWFGGPERFVGVVLRRVDDCAGRQDEHEGLERVIGILRDAAAHSARVVGEDASHHARVDGGRVRPDLGAKRPEPRVDGGADGTGLDADATAAVEDLDVSPVPREVGKHAVGHRLTGEARARGPKRQRHPFPAREREQRAHVLDRTRPHDRLRDDPIDAGVRRERGQVNRPGQNVLGSDSLTKKVQDGWRHRRLSALGSRLPAVSDFGREARGPRPAPLPADRRQLTSRQYSAGRG